ncbi:O-antigen ligase family protein [Candidatus Daviesbacteria bacterium]|nr:O-antigen ligase family protein [Candidatus Daviesbacteria bacterium]
MRRNLTAPIDYLIFALISGLTFLIPIFFVNLTTEFYEMPKLILLVIFVAILLLLWSLKWVIAGKVAFTKTPLDLPLILLAIVFIVSTLFSTSQPVSIFGAFPRVSNSTVAWLSYICLYFVIVSNLKTKLQIITIYSILNVSALFISFLTILSYLGIFLPVDALNFIKFVNFSPTGSSFATSGLLILLLPLPLISLVQKNKNMSQILALALATLYLITIILIGSYQIYALAVILAALVAFIYRQDFKNKSSLLFLIPILIAVILYGLSFINLNSTSNFLYQQKQNFPQEIQLSLANTWTIAASSFRDKPFLGSGPATFINDFSLYKPIDFNLSQVWNLRFDSGFNEYLVALSTLGGLGLIALIFLTVNILIFSKKGLKIKDDKFTTSLAISSVVIIGLLLIHSITLVTIFASLLILGFLMANNKSISSQIEELTLGIKASKLTDSDLVTNLIIGDILPMILLIPILILVIFVVWHTKNATMAEYHHRQALNLASKNSLLTYENLRQSENLNPYIDTYRTDLAQTNLSIANAIAFQKGPTQASPSGSLTDNDKQTIQQLLSQAIDEARFATSLNPQSSINWEILASIYRQISGVAQNALAFSLDAYGRAIQHDPLNPLLRLNVGGVYYSVRNYDLAIRFFNDSVNLKPDFANGYYNLSVALRDKGSLEEAKLAAEKVVSLLDPKSPDYKVASAYLADLKQKIATASSNQTTEVNQVTPPAAAENGPLQKKTLPKVLDNQLKNAPENIATPEAIRK